MQKDPKTNNAGIVFKSALEALHKATGRSSCSSIPNTSHVKCVCLIFHSIAKHTTLHRTVVFFSTVVATQMLSIRGWHCNFADKTARAICCSAVFVETSACCFVEQEKYTRCSDTCHCLLNSVAALILILFLCAVVQRSFVVVVVILNFAYNVWYTLHGDLKYYLLSNLVACRRRFLTVFVTLNSVLREIPRSVTCPWAGEMHRARRRV